MVKKIKLAYVTQFPSNVGEPQGGVEAVSVCLVGALSQLREFDIHVVTLDSSIDAVERVFWSGVEIHRLPRPFGSELICAAGKGKRLVCDYLRELGPDIIHAHDTYGLMTADYPAPRVFTVHGFIYGDTLISKKRFSRLRSMLWEYYEKKAWGLQPNIVSISPYVRERVSSVSRATIYDIENPVLERFFELERNEQKGVIFTSAVISPRKNVLVLIKVVSLLVKKGYNIQLRVAGGATNKAYADEVKAWVDANSLGEHIVFLGRVSVETIIEEVSKASIYALVSLEENAPMGIEEAMAVGIPVVASNRCGMPYMVRHAESGYLVDPFDEVSIASRLKAILDDGNLRRRMGEKSKSIATELYHPGRVAKRTALMYEEVIALQKTHRSRGR